MADLITNTAIAGNQIPATHHEDGKANEFTLGTTFFDLGVPIPPTVRRGMVWSNSATGAFWRTKKLGATNDVTSVRVLEYWYQAASPGIAGDPGDLADVDGKTRIEDGQVWIASGTRIPYVYEAGAPGWFPLVAGGGVSIPLILTAPENTEALRLEADAAATAGNVNVDSPYQEFKGYGWDGGASQVQRMRQRLLVDTSAGFSGTLTRTRIGWGIAGGGVEDVAIEIDPVGLTTGITLNGVGPTIGSRLAASGTVGMRHLNPAFSLRWLFRLVGPATGDATEVVGFNNDLAATALVPEVNSPDIRFRGARWTGATSAAVVAAIAYGRVIDAVTREAGLHLNLGVAGAQPGGSVDWTNAPRMVFGNADGGGAVDWTIGYNDAAARVLTFRNLSTGEFSSQWYNTTAAGGVPVIEMITADPATAGDKDIDSPLSTWYGASWDGAVSRLRGFALGGVIESPADALDLWAFQLQSIAFTAGPPTVTELLRIRQDGRLTLDGAQDWTAGFNEAADRKLTFRNLDAGGNFYAWLQRYTAASADPVLEILSLDDATAGNKDIDSPLQTWYGASWDGAASRLRGFFAGVTIDSPADASDLWSWRLQSIAFTAGPPTITDVFDVTGTGYVTAAGLIDGSAAGMRTRHVTNAVQPVLTLNGEFVFWDDTAAGYWLVAHIGGADRVVQLV